MMMLMTMPIRPASAADNCS